jgi:purine-binding chemotaxis protein CheW
MPHILVVRLDGNRLGLPLARVERLIRATWVEYLPAAPASVLGAIDVGGRVLPVIDARQPLGLPRRPVEPSDCFVIAHTGRRAVALLVDAGEGIREYDQRDMIASESVVPGIAQAAGVLPLADGLVLVHDLGELLSLDDERGLDAVMESA